METYKTCLKCKEIKTINCFTKASHNPDGYNRWCKSCKAEEKRSRKHGPGCKTYASSAKGCDPLVPIETYHSDTCEICEEVFYPRGPTYKRCLRCSKIANGIVYKSLVRYAVTNETVSLVTKKYLHTKVCAYCARPFTEDNPRWFDHIIPRCLGGNNEADNISLCCRECNLSKAGLSLDKWIELCRLVILNQ
jgi:5-methylcytosine-specific restriction endonuclease McrA